MVFTGYSMVAVRPVSSLRISVTATSGLAWWVAAAISSNVDTSCTSAAGTRRYT